MTLKSDAKFKEKLTFGFKYDIKNFVNFHPTTQKSLSYKNTEELSFMTLNSDEKFE